MVFLLQIMMILLLWTYYDASASDGDLPFASDYPLVEEYDPKVEDSICTAHILFTGWWGGVTDLFW